MEVLAILAVVAGALVAGWIAWVIVRWVIPHIVWFLLFFTELFTIFIPIIVGLPLTVIFLVTWSDNLAVVTAIIAVALQIIDSKLGIRESILLWRECPHDSTPQLNFHRLGSVSICVICG